MPREIAHDRTPRSLCLRNGKRRKAKKGRLKIRKVTAGNPREWKDTSEAKAKCVKKRKYSILSTW
jgi:hypothetical protein